MKYKQQVEFEHYTKSEYLKIDRWISYYYQLNSIRDLEYRAVKSQKIKSILEIGVGDGTISTILKKRGYNLKTMDIAKDLKPDIVSSLPNIPIVKRVDLILCCEVLEHIKYEDVVKSLTIMSKKTRFLVLSIPHKSLYISLNIRLSLLKPLKLLFTLPTSFIKHKFNGEHYWELGTLGYSVRKFRNSMEISGFKLINDFRVREYPYHHFFVLESKKS